MAKISKTINPDERTFQTWFKNNFLGWVSQFHPGPSSDVGCPDLFVLLNQGNVTPVEIKIGSLDGEGNLWTKEIRPSQIRWHSALAIAGGISLIVCGVWSGDRWRIFSINGADAKKWHEDGFKVGVDAIEIHSDDLVNGLSDFVFDWIE